VVLRRPEDGPLLFGQHRSPGTTAYIAGLDLGQSQDYSALAILEHGGPGEEPPLPEQTWNARHLQRWPLQTPYTAIVADVVAMLAQPPPAGATTLALDMTGVGRPVVDLFRVANTSERVRDTDGQWQRLPPALAARLVPIQITGGNQVTGEGDGFNVPKRDLAGGVQVALQTSRLKIAAGLPDTQVLVQELQNFRVKISLAGHDSYGAGAGEEWRVGAHDDLVLAVAIALWVGEAEPIGHYWIA
jgi:hypothetical protein